LNTSRKQENIKDDILLEAGMKSVGLVTFILGILAATYFVLQNSNSVTSFHENSFKALWAEDLKKLEASGKLPAGWKDLNNVEITVTSPTLKPWLENYSPEFAVKPTGKYKLQVFLDDFQEDRATGVMIQYHLIDLASQDTVWELGRTLQL
jgi:hypothetical protein